ALPSSPNRSLRRSKSVNCAFNRSIYVVAASLLSALASRHSRKDSMASEITATESRPTDVSRPSASPEEMISPMSSPGDGHVQPAAAQQARDKAPDDV